jgi:hypothetical protein
MYVRTIRIGSTFAPELDERGGGSPRFGLRSGRVRSVWQRVKRCGRNSIIKVGVTRIHIAKKPGARRLESSARRRTSCAAPAPLPRIGTSPVRLPAA